MFCHCQHTRDSSVILVLPFQTRVTAKAKINGEVVESVHAFLSCCNYPAGWSTESYSLQHYPTDVEVQRYICVLRLPHRRG
jgi:hypothetical protein